MSTRTSGPSSDSTQSGALIGEYGGGIMLVVLVILGIACLLFGVFGLFGGEDYDTPSRLIVVALGIIAFVVFIRSRGAHAQLFDRSFTISRGGKTISGRWEDIANITHQRTRRYLYGLIPLPGISHTYIVTMRNGDRVKIDSAFSHAEEAGENMQRMWRKAVTARSDVQGS